MGGQRTELRNIVHESDSDFTFDFFLDDDVTSKTGGEQKLVGK